MRAILIDDSRLARQELKRLLVDFEQIQILGEAANAEEANIQIEKEHPDLIFLDIQMPGKNGFELLESLDYIPEVVFTTAYDQYAIRAFEYNALDYLQKPIKKERLAKAISKVLERGEKKQEMKQVTSVMQLTDQVFVKDGERCWFVQLANISLFEVAGSYTKVYFDEFCPMIPRTLNYLEARLDPKLFFRLNRQFIINLKWVERIEPWFSGSIKVYMKGGKELELSRRQSQKFKELMSF